MKKKTMKARGLRFADHQWNHLVKKAKKYKATPSDVARALIELDIEKDSIK